LRWLKLDFDESAAYQICEPHKNKALIRVPKLLPLKDFRARRRVLTADDYADPGDEVSPRDLIEQDTWEYLTTLPTDVAVQTSDHHGTQLKILYALCSLWIKAIDLPKNGETHQNDMTLIPMATASEEFDAATFAALHGFYRPSIGCARNALEVVTVACACQTLKLHKEFKAWQDGSDEFLFGRACDLLINAESLRELRKRLADRSDDSLFDQGTRDGRGWVRRLYNQLSNYAHSRPGFTGHDLWNGSNGPVYDTDAFQQCFDVQIETFAACYLLTKIAKPDLRMAPQAQNILFKDHSGSWLNVAAEAAKEIGLIGAT
jgi:hypothetical protein